MAQLGQKTRYIGSIVAQDADNDTLILRDTPVGQDGMAPLGTNDSLVVAKPHEHKTNDAITVTYTV